MSGLLLPSQFDAPEQKEGTMRFLFPDGVDVVSLKKKKGEEEGAYVVHLDWSCGAVSPDESRAAKDLCSAAKQVKAGKMSVEQFMDTFYPEEEHFYTRECFFEERILKKRADGTLEMNIEFK